MSLAIKHRPKTLDDVVGNEPVKESIKSLFTRKKKDIPHAYLFFGPRGCGKTTTARIVGNMLNCPDEEIQEYNMANTRGIDTIRVITENCMYSSISGNPRVYIFDEIHRQTKDAQNALLKLLEEPPENVYIILCTTEPQALLPTITSRCHSYQMKTLKPSEIINLIDSILDKEGFDVAEYPPEIKKEISRLAEGLPRNALVLLDAIIDMDDADKALESLSSVSFSEANFLEICQSLLNHTPWSNIRKDVKQLILDGDSEGIRLGVLSYMQKVLFDSTNDRALYIIEIFSDNTYASGKPYLTSMFYRVCQK